MKTSSLILSSILSLASQAAVPTTVVSAKTYIENTEEFENLEHYKIEMVIDSKDSRRLLQHSNRCTNPKFFLSASPQMASDLTLNPIIEGYQQAIEEGLADYDDGYSSVMESLGEYSMKLIKELQDSKIEICTDEYSAPYSEGQIDTFVKINDSLSYVIRVGFPD